MSPEPTVRGTIVLSGFIRGKYSFQSGCALVETNKKSIFLTPSNAGFSLLATNSLAPSLSARSCLLLVELNTTTSQPMRFRNWIAR